MRRRIADKKASAKRPERKKKKRNLKPLFRAFGAVCFLSFVYTLITFRDVFMDYTISVLMGCFFGIIGAFATKDKDLKGIMFFGCGSLAFSAPLFINNAFADDKIITEKVLIMDRQAHYRRSGPSVNIEYAGYEMKVNVDHEEQMKSSAYLIIKVRKGALGYYILEDSELADN